MDFENRRYIRRVFQGHADCRATFAVVLRDFPACGCQYRQTCRGNRYVWHKFGRVRFGNNAQRYFVRRRGTKGSGARARAFLSVDDAQNRLPQALKNSLPALGNELIALVKDTSVAGFIAVFDLTQAFKLIGSSSYEFMIPYLVLALFYLVIVGILTVIIKMIERRFAKSDK